MTDSNLVNLAKQHIQPLQDLWATLDDAYPFNYQDLSPKSIPLIDCLEKLSQSRVLDIGCNSGLYTCLAGRYAHSIVGVDTSSPLIRRAELAKGYFEQNVFSSHNVSFAEGNFADQLSEHNIDAVIASLVLYHLGDKNIELFKAFLSSTAKRILIQARPGRLDAFNKHPEWGKVSSTKTYNGLYKIEDCLEFLRDCGFQNAEVLRMDTYYFEYFPIIFAEK